MTRFDHHLEPRLPPPFPGLVSPPVLCWHGSNAAPAILSTTFSVATRPTAIATARTGRPIGRTCSRPGDLSRPARPVGKCTASADRYDRTASVPQSAAGITTQAHAGRCTIRCRQMDREAALRAPPQAAPSSQECADGAASQIGQHSRRFRSVARSQCARRSAHPRE